MGDLVVDEFRRIYHSAGARFAFLASARNIYLEAPFGHKGFYPRLAALKPPALFIWGSHDPLVPAAFGRHVRRWLPGAEQVTLERCGHVPQVERPEETNELLLRFFAQAERPQPARRARPAPAPTPTPKPRNHPTRRWRREPSPARPAATATAPRTAGPQRPVDAGRSTLLIVRGATSQPGPEAIPRADLDERDPDYIREQLPWMWLLASAWFRGEVRGLGNIPD